jgi:PhzF family phenazine biosynthesis protein
MKASMIQADAFTGEGLLGNRAAVCLLDHWLPDEILQTAATRNGLSETAFLVQDADVYELRWFTPLTEVDLCGHATLASGYVVFHHLEPGRTSVSFRTRSGVLGVTREGEILTLDFPARPPVEAPPPEGIGDAMGLEPEQVLATPRDWMVVYRTEEDVRVLAPDREMLLTFDRPGVIATAPGDVGYDFVSRFFAPSVGVAEDPVTGSAHCALIPYWAKRLGRSELHAAQISEQGGELFCVDRGERVSIGGRVEPFLEATIDL